MTHFADLVQGMLPESTHLVTKPAVRVPSTAQLRMFSAVACCLTIFERGYHFVLKCKADNVRAHEEKIRN